MSARSQTHNWKKELFIGFILFAGLCSWLFPEDASALRRKTSTNRECAICHIMWLEEFKRQDVKPLVPYDPLPREKTGKQDVASTEQMCFSCHDGFVLDSRFKWKKNRYNHPVGVKPSDDVTIPTAEGKTVFPMNEDGKIYCGTCHSAHGIDWKEKDTTLFLRIDNRNSNMCTACHLNRVTGPKEGNHPVNKKLKKLPAALVKAGSLFSNKNEVICQSCHLAHGSEQKKMLARPNHNSDLCSSCHVQQARVRQTKHNLTILAPSAKNERGDVASESGPCSACHVPHKANAPKLWARPVSVNQDRGSAYCLSCHKEKGVARKKSINKHSHPVDVPLRRAGIIAKRDGWISQVKNRAAPKKIVKLPLFDKAGGRVSVGGNVTCMTCHDPHLWSPDHGQTPARDLRKLEGDGSNSFLRIANNSDSTLCKNCHREQAAVAWSKHNLQISAPDQKNKDGMTVSESGVCSACHVPHNGKGENMWARKIGKKGKGVMTLCIGCHAKDSMAENRTTGKHSHPVHVSLKKSGLTTDLPLFTKHARRDDKYGRVDCASCHNPHQWDPGNAIASSGRDPDTDGDASNSFLRIRASGKARLCVNCHKDQAGLIGTDHDLSVTARNGLNAREQTVRQSGPCGQCHAVHHAELSRRLWVQKAGSSGNRTEKLCTGCHSRQGVGRKKVPAELDHPPRVLSVNKGRLREGDRNRQQVPVFTEQGKSDDVGMISCLTCHDPHQWNASSQKAGTGKNLEGDVRNSFLRHTGTEYFLCADCHGEDSLYRYKYFHWSKSRSDKNKK